MDEVKKWLPELNRSQVLPLQRLGWRIERIELLNRISEACRFLSESFSQTSAQNLAKTVFDSSNFAAVGISKRQDLLAFVGSSIETESGHLDRLCPAIKLCLETGSLQTCRREPQSSLLSNCWITPLEELEDSDTTLRWLAAIPLANDKEVMGALIVYGSELYPLNSSTLELAKWIGSEVNCRLELGRLKGSAGQVAQAELKALRAQISPHFLFNALNSIAALIRIDAEQARDLIVDFASFFRRTLKQNSDFVTLAEELSYITHYIRFEKVRFGPNLKVDFELAPNTENVAVPILTVQPLVENAIQHGIAAKLNGGQVWIRTRAVSDGEVEISVEDTGVGISSDIINRIKTGNIKGEGLGMALNNINERLQKIYGTEYKLNIESIPQVGTKVSFRVPRIRRI